MKNRVWLRLLVSLLFVTVALSMFACTDRNPASTVTTAPPSNVETTEPDNTDSNATESDTTRSETTESGTTESGTADPGTTETTDPGTTDPGTTETTDTGDTTETEVIPGPYIPADPNVETKGEETTEEPQKGCHPRYAWNEGYHWSPACDVCGKSEGNKIAHTGYCTVEDEGDVLMYSYFCMRCEATIGRLEIPYDVDLYFDPMTLAESKGDFVEVVGSAFSSAEGTPSARFTSVDNTGRYVTIYEDPNTSTPTGKYLAMKIKLRSGRSSFRLSVSSIEGNKTGSPMFVALKGLTPGWASVIVDLSKI